MTHIIEIGGYEFTQIQNGQKRALVRPKRDVKVDDTVVFENDMQQHVATAVNIQTSPGLMKGWVLLTLEK